MPLRVAALWKFLATMLAAGACATTLLATTLTQLALPDMIQQSTAIVRAKVLGTSAANRNGQIYTHYRLQVLENIKSTTPSITDVAVPGGALNGVRQLVAGAPELVEGQEYVLFLWTSKSGMTQVIGLSQGLFDVAVDASGKETVARAAISETMMDASGRPVKEAALTGPVNMSLADLRARVKQVMGGAK